MNSRSDEIWDGASVRGKFGFLKSPPFYITTGNVGNVASELSGTGARGTARRQPSSGETGIKIDISTHEHFVGELEGRKKEEERASEEGSKKYSKEEG